MGTSLPNEIVVLEARKSRLQSECDALSEKMKNILYEHDVVAEHTKILQAAHDVMKDQAVIVDRVVGEIIQTSTLHTSEMKTIMSDIRAISTEVVERGNENVAQTKIILEKLPRYIFELQKPIPVRRLYSPARGTHIPPEEKN